MNLYDLLTIDRSSLYGVRRGLGSIADLLPRFQSTRPLRGATINANIDAKFAALISIHAPLAGCDLAETRNPFPRLKFQSTRPMRGATIMYLLPVLEAANISIHAPHAGRDLPPTL